MRVPTVEIGDMRQRGVGDFGFTRQECLRRRGHADQVAAPGAEQVAFSARGEARAVFDQNRRAAMDGSAGCLDSVSHNAAQVSAGRVRHRDMRDQTVFKERARTCLNGVIDDLIEGGDVARLIVLAQGADGVDRDDEADAQLLQGKDVCAVRQG